jgi:hypothetical protein
MNLRRRVLWLALNGLVAIATGAFGLGVRAKSSDAFIPYIAITPPQRAQGDFDGDGRIDTALVQERAGTARISIQLSGSSSPVVLEGAATGVVEGDVDGDGDLDLVAATPSGDLLIWINDGRGRFTRQVASRTGGVSNGPEVARTTWYETPAIGAVASPSPSPASGETAPVVSRILASTAGRRSGVHSSVPPPLRAPPVRSL